jgi:uncharacterized protein (DUF924 family)
VDRSMLRVIYDYWFGENPPADRVDFSRVGFWMEQSDATDNDIRDRFGHLIAEAAKQEWPVEELSREEGMALVVLFDQFPRNIFRSTGEQFAYDETARDITRRLLVRGLDSFTKSERFFLALPFQHHEDPADQDYAVFLAVQEAVNAPEDQKDGLRRAVDFATKHRDLIRKFGRYPHRNAVLGRESTPEELAFLKEHGRGF